MSTKVEPKTESARTWWNRGRQAERAERMERRHSLPLATRMLVSYIETVAHSDEQPSVPLLLRSSIIAFHTDLTRRDRRAIRRALRGKP